MKDVNISTATKNNWERLGKGDIETDAEIISRLSKRANKQYSVKNIIPVEYFFNPQNSSVAEKILKYSKDNKFDIKIVIFNLALNYLSKNDLIFIGKSSQWSTKNFYLEKILQEFCSNIYDDYLLNLNFPEDEVDFLGIVYQSLLLEGNKNKQGSYYTPCSIVKFLCKGLSEDSVFLDPCCGTGSFLLNGAAKICKPENIFGCDIDEIACFIAKINLIIYFKDIIFNPNIYNIDVISENEVFSVNFDVIATNPPWGAQIKSDSRKLFPEIKSGESFSYIIAKSARLLKSDGSCCFVLPESVLNIKAHKDIRKFILKNFAVREINMLGKIFSGVLTDVILLKLDKTVPSEVLIYSNGSETQIEQKIFEKNENYNFTIFNNKDAIILKKIYSIPHKTLENSRWGLGIVTGNNKKHIISNHQGAEIIYTGKEVKKYFLNDTDKYIYYTPDNFQQCAPEDLYRAQEKLIYKFISKKLVFAYDDTCSLVLNSANILLPNVETHNIKTVLAFLNSNLFQYIYKKKFNVLKVLKSNLLELPFPILEKEEAIYLEKLVNSYLKCRKDEILTEIDNFVYKIFQLNISEIEYVAHEL